MTDTRAKVLLDTNILVYAYDSAEPKKRQAAIETLDRLIRNGQAVLSTQILGEFFSVTTRHRNPLLLVTEAIQEVENYIINCEILSVTPGVIQEALRGIRSHQFSYWDAQIWACARVHGITEVYSEDFATGSTVEGVQFTNPLV